MSVAERVTRAGASRLCGAIFLMIIPLSLACGGSHKASAAADGSQLTGSSSAPQCDGGYAIEGAAVTVMDEHNTIIGSGTTGTADVGTANGRDVCVTRFTVQLTHRAQFYQVKVGTHGGPTWGYDELKARGFHVDLSLN